MILNRPWPAVASRVWIGVRSHFVTRLPEWLMAGLAMVGDGILLMHGALRFDSNRAYAPLRTVAVESVWGLVAINIGGLWLLALFLNGTFESFRRISPWLRAVCALASSTYMTAFSTGMLIGNPGGDGYLMHGTIAATAAVYCVIIMREVKAVENRENVKCRMQALKIGST